MVPYSSYIDIQRDAPIPVYVQIANQIALAVQKKHLLDGLKLPGSRKMAEILGVHRNTVSNSYAVLEAQGWVRTEVGRGTFIQWSVQDQLGGDTPLKRSTGFPNLTGFGFRRWTLLDQVYGRGVADIRMDDGLPDIRLSNLDHLARLFHTNMKRRGTLGKLEAENKAAHHFYREHLTHYLNLTRGMGILEDQLLITRSRELGMNIVAETLIRPGDTVIVGELSYFAANMILQKAGARVQTVPMDEDGIIPDALREIYQRRAFRLLYLTPQYHYPTTVTLSAKRRETLLQMSAELGFIILEDDYDFDFNYDQRPLLPLAAMDTEGMVVYLGTFGRTMPSAFRSGYVIAPQPLIHEMQKLHAVMDRYGDPLGELALGELIADGAIYHYLRESIQEYKKRRDTMAQELALNFGHLIDFEVPNGGLALWTTWPNSLNLVKLSKACSKEGLFIPPYLLYQSKKLSGMRMGFGSLNPAEIRRSVEIMKSAYNLSENA